MRLQQFRSAAVIADAGMAHAMIGAASITSDNTEIMTLAAVVIAVGQV